MPAPQRRLDQPSRRRPALVGGLVSGLVVTTLALVACGGDDGGDAETFCADLETNLSRIVDPQIESAADAEAQIQLFRDLADSAPLALEEDWRALLNVLETANEVVPGDDASEQAAAAAAYASERSGIFVAQWVTTNCGLDLGPVVTVGNVAPPTTTTIPGATTSTTTSPSTTSG